MGAAFASGFPPPDALPSSLSLETSPPSQEEHRFAPHRFRTAGMLVLVVILESSLGVQLVFMGIEALWKQREGALQEAE